MGAGLVSRRSGRGRRRSRPMSEINVTPFVDVMLVLLIIFMVAAPLLTVGVPLELPRTAANPLPQPDERPLTIQLAADGRVFVQDEEVDPARLPALLAALARERRDEKVYLRADQGLPYGRVMEVMGALNAGGFRSIGLVADPAAPASGDKAG
ncbi:protein TolR [Oceanicella actignis]|uniref:protein TolR n=1 Tax=Oceanicella actignis TaxID=1189325 RepID=UPI0011E8284E|nr:protein TolR [Oceanicella actignis]TYO90428.1 cell division and transport-associated protein TolR [Oceanicella actignis]